jgi:exopolysaccharide biosynthesis polyprenyl glycosylphosphotransferase
MMKLLNIILMTLPFAGCWFFYYAERAVTIHDTMGKWIVVGLFVLLYVIFARIYDAFLISLNRISEIIYSQCVSVLISDAIIFVVLWLLSWHFPNLLPALAALACQILLAVVWSFFAHQWYFKVFPPKRSAIVFDRQFAMDKLIPQYGLEKKFHIQKKLHVQECLQDFSVLEDMQVVFIGGVRSNERNAILKYCVSKGIDAYVLPRIGDIIMSGARKMHMFHLPVLRAGRCALYPEQRLLKRIFDIISSGIVLLVVSPVMIITAIAIKLSDGGPVFYKQNRFTKDGKVFKVLKFRSMRIDAEKDGVARLSTGDKDDRITPVGRVIRKLRIDELPQLLNILGGSMSVVGPRPERPEIAAQYEKELPEFKLRLQVKAGLTGYAQVYGKYNTTPYDKLQMDLMYIANPSFLEDLKIIFATIKILFMPESTDGIAEGQTTAMTEDASNEEKEFASIGK